MFRDDPLDNDFPGQFSDAISLHVVLSEPLETIIVEVSGLLSCRWDVCCQSVACLISFSNVSIQFEELTDELILVDCHLLKI